MAGEGRTPAPRVAAPAGLPLPEHPEVALWRPAVRADLDPLWELNRAMSLADHPNHITTRAGLQRLFQLSYFRPGRDSLLGFDASGQMIASGMVIMPPGYETLARSIVFGGVHPGRRGRGIGSEVLAWQLGRAMQQLESTPDDVSRWIVAFTDERARQDRRLFQSAEMQLARYFVSMERVLAEPIEAPSELHPGIRLGPFSPKLWDAVLEARNESFRDHWGSQPLSVEAWRTLIGGPTFRPDLSFVAVGPMRGHAGGGSRSRSGEEIVGFLLGSVNAADWPHQGFTDSYVPMVGVRPEWRGRHIALALLTRHLEASRALGHERVTLDADTDSATGALILYERLGFRHGHRKLAFVLEV